MVRGPCTVHDLLLKRKGTDKGVWAGSCALAAWVDADMSVYLGALGNAYLMCVCERVRCVGLCMYYCMIMFGPSFYCCY